VDRQGEPEVVIQATTSGTPLVKHALRNVKRAIKFNLIDVEAVRGKCAACMVDLGEVLVGRRPSGQSPTLFEETRPCVNAFPPPAGSRETLCSGKKKKKKKIKKNQKNQKKSKKSATPLEPSHNRRCPKPNEPIPYLRIWQIGDGTQRGDFIGELCGLNVACL
jgi:hypothetical protein